MPKKLEPNEAKPFQPIQAASLRGVLDDDAPPAPVTEQRAEERAVTQPPAPREPEAKVVHIRPPEPEAAPRRGRAPLASTAAGERLNRPLKVQLQSSERTEILRIVNELSSTLGTSVSVSHVTRALLTVFRHAESEVQKRARERGSLRRPPNDDLTAIAVFEYELAKLLLGALRNTRPMRE